MNGIVKYQDYKIELLNKHEVLSGLTDKERMIAELVKNSKIKELNDEELVRKCGVLVKGICSDFGIRKVEPDQVLRFYELVKFYYANLTLKEVKKAFELLSVGELDYFLPKTSRGDADSGHYQQFTMAWAGKVLQAYQKYRARIWSKINDLNSTILIEVTDEYKEEQRRLFIKTIYGFAREYEETGIISVMHPIYLADFLVKNEIIEKQDVEDRHVKKAYQILMNSDRISTNERNELESLFKVGQVNLSLEKNAEHLLAMEMVEKGFKRLLDGTKEL